MTPLADAGGYLRVLLSKNKKKKTVCVHILVLEAWKGKRPTGKVACHNDGNRQNNTPSNLRWDTYEGNSADARRHGTLYSGEKHHSARLSAMDVLAIRGRLAIGEPHRKIAKDYGVSGNAVWKIAQNKSWSQVN